MNEIVLRLAGSLREVQAALKESAAEGVVLHPQMFLRLYRRLVWTFSARVIELRAQALRVAVA